MATIASRWRLDNDYVDDDGANDLTEGGTGNAFSTSTKKVGTHALQLNGSGWAKDTSISGLPTGDSEFSFGGWVNLSSLTGNQCLVSGGTLSSGQCAFLYTVDATTISYDAFGGGWALNFTVPTMSANVWYWIWATFTTSDNSVRVYLNNTESSSGAQTLAGNMNMTFGSVEVGGFFSNDGSRITGYVDDVQWWTGVTSLGERTTIYNQGLSFIPKVVLF